MGSKPLAHRAGERQAVSHPGAQRKRGGAIRTRQSRLRYDTRIDHPQGWRSSFMSF